MNNDFDERHERMEILVGVMSDYEALSEFLIPQEPNYKAIIASIGECINELRNARKRIKELKATGGLYESKGIRRSNLEGRHGENDA
jgi:hypothetical protein